VVLLLRAAVQRLSDSCRHKSSGGKLLERVLFNGTQFSNLYTTVDTPARGCVWVCVVFVCKYVLGHSRVSQPLNLRLSAIMLTWDFFKISCSEHTLAEEGRAFSDEEKRWDDQTDWMTFEVRKGDTTVSSVWTNSVRNAFRKQAGWAKLQEARTSAAKHWTERVWYRHNQSWLQLSKEGTEAGKSGSFKDDKEWGKKCFEDLDH